MNLEHLTELMGCKAVWEGDKKAHIFRTSDRDRYIRMCEIAGMLMKQPKSRRPRFYERGGNGSDRFVRIGMH